MTQEELNYIKDSFSQILDDIGGNPDWYEAAKAVASDLGTIEKQLEERVTKFPSNLDEVAKKYELSIGSQDYCYMDIEDAFKAGAEWMAGQGEFKEGIVCDNNEFVKFHDSSYIDLCPDMNKMAFDVKDGNEVIVQIRKK